MDNTNSEKQLSLFERLSQIRNDKGIKLQEISAKTRIHMRYLEAIESGETELIPDIYDMLFFKTYLAALNLENDQEYLKEYQQLRKAKRPPQQQTTIIRRVRTEKKNRRKSGLLKIIYIAAPLLVVAIIIIILAINSTKVEQVPKQEVEELSVHQIVQQMEIETQQKMLQDSSVADSVLTEVILHAVQRTWLRVVKDHTDTTEYLLATNEKLSLLADSVLSFLVGNAAGIDFTVNGKAEGILGSPDQVILFLKITKQGIVNKQLKRIKIEEQSVDTLGTH